MRPYNLFYAPVHALVGMAVVYITTRSFTVVFFYVVLDATLHGIFVHELAHNAGNRVKNGDSDFIESAFFFVFHLFAAFTLSAIVTLGDFHAAVKIGLTEPIAQGIVQFIYLKVWRFIHAKKEKKQLHMNTTS